MILDLARLSSEETISGDQVVVYPDVSGEDNRIRCHAEVDVRRQGDTYTVHVELSGVFSTPCHKCLEAVTSRISPSFDLVVRRTTPHADAGSVQPGDDFVQLPAGQSRLELDPFIYENLVADIPMRITCRDDCKGLCATCGANLNVGECRCAPAADERWNALKALKQTKK